MTSARRQIASDFITASRAAWIDTRAAAGDDEMAFFDVPGRRRAAIAILTVDRRTEHSLIEKKKNKVGWLYQGQEEE